MSTAHEQHISMNWSYSLWKELSVSSLRMSQHIVQRLIGLYHTYIADEFKAYAEKMPEYAKLFTTYQQLMQEDEEPREPTEGAKTTEEETKEPSSADSSKVKAE